MGREGVQGSEPVSLCRCIHVRLWAHEVKMEKNLFINWVAWELRRIHPKTKFNRQTATCLEPIRRETEGKLTNSVKLLISMWMHLKWATKAGGGGGGDQREQHTKCWPYNTWLICDSYINTQQRERINGNEQKSKGWSWIYKRTDDKVQNERMRHVSVWAHQGSTR